MIHLRPMTSQEFDAFKAHSLPAFAAAKSASEGLSHEDAMAVAIESFARLLPDGFESKGNYFYQVIETSADRSVGHLWFARRPKGSEEWAFVCEIEIEEASRGKGYGKKTMLLLEDEVRKLDLKSIGLHVFGSNHRARGLYESLGFQTTNVNMRKDLSQ
jgi:ribosomal protein S18 acetylase RimI-like enzyme